MQQKTIQVGKKKLLVLDMPEDCLKWVSLHDCVLVYRFSNKWGGIHHLDKELAYQLIGFKTDLTESQWAEIVERCDDGLFIQGEAYVNYQNDEEFYHTAEWSGLSLLQANDCNYNNALIIEII